MTLQDAFDKIYAGTRGPRKRAVGNGGVCAFLGSDGVSRCFIGMLMTPEQLSKAVETPWGISDALCALGFARRDQDVLRLVQLVHDLEPPSGWDAKLAAVAHEHGLQYPPKEAVS